MNRKTFFSHLLWTVVALGVVMVTDASGLDLPLARPFGTAQGFVLRDHWLFAVVLHDGARRAGWLAAATLTVAVWWPVGILRRLERLQRMQLAVTTLLLLLLVCLLKFASRTSCRWELSEFGGTAHLVSHWAWGVDDGGPGHCFPAGHAAAGFAFVAGYFVLRPVAPVAARVWLAATFGIGLLLGLAQQGRGAHFLSHTAWTAWLCWAVAWTVDGTLRVFRRVPADGPETPARAATPAQAN